MQEKRNFSFFSGKTRIVLLVILAISLLSVIVYALNFTSAPSINGGDTLVYTVDDLVCSWGESGDVTETNVSWYNNSVLYSTETASGTSSTLDDQYTTKGQVWTCEVTISDGVSAISENISAYINNSGPREPVLKLNGTALTDYYEILEDYNYSLYLYAPDDDNDTLIYSITDLDGGNLCTIISSSSGLTSCYPTHLTLTETSSPSPEAPIQYLLRLRAEETGSSGFGSYYDFTFNITPVNDQAYFTQNISNILIPADTNTSISVYAEDEEQNYPLNFTLWSDLNDLVPGMLIITNTSNKTANITFNITPMNEQAGNWTVVVNVSDVNGSNSSRAYNQINFTLTINLTNYNPDFTTNFTNLSLQSWIQEGSLEVWFSANDSNEDDNLTFNVTMPSNSSLRCNIDFPWMISTENSSGTGATGLINVSNLTNDYVACRYVDLVVYDQVGGAETYPNFLLNVTNINDAPVVHEIGEDGNISNQYSKLYSNFVYSVNASDPDQLTYDSANTGVIRYYSNESLFPINLNTGVMDITPNNLSYIGTWNINITVSDGLLNDSIIMILEIQDNEVPVLNLSPNNYAFYQNNVSEISFTANELDNETMTMSFDSLTSFDDGIYDSLFSLVSNNYALGTNLENWTLDMQKGTARERNELVGVHRISITFRDESNSSFEEVSTGILNFSIINENDVPFFDTDLNNISDVLAIEYIVANVSYSLNINVTDYDLYLGVLANETLTFSYSSPSIDLKNISITKNSNNSATLNFTSSNNGSQSINVTVIDSNGSRYSQVVAFDVLSNSIAPTFQMIRPYFNATSHSVVQEFINASNYPARVNYINITENTTLVFDALITNDSFVEDNYLNLEWYINGVLNNTIENATTTEDSNFTRYFNFFSVGTYNVTLKAIDVRYSESQWTWIVRVSNLNRPPVYCPGVLEDLIPPDYVINGTYTVSDYLSYSSGGQRFYDPDDDLTNTGEVEKNCSNYLTPDLESLTYEIYEPLLCSIAEFSFLEDAITIIPSETGGCFIQFTATDDYNESVVSTDVVTVQFIGAEPSQGEDTPTDHSGGSTTKTEVIPIPIEQEVDKPVPIKILAPGLVTTYANRTIYVPLRIKNTWTADVRGIELSGLILNATMAHENNITVTFETAFFSVISSGEEVQTVLEITNYRTEGPYEVVIYARVAEPEFMDSTNILISSLEQSSIGEEIKGKVTFAKDMLIDNPVCRELNELLDRAEEEASVSNFEEALKLVDGVINGCKYLQEQEVSRRESPSVIKKAFDLSRTYSLQIIAGAVFILIVTLILYAAAALRRKIIEK